MSSLVARILDRLGLAADVQSNVPSRYEAEQAVLDLLELAMLVDRSSAEAERALIREFIDSRDWPGGENPYAYAEEATARVREALAPDGDLDGLLAAISARLGDDDDRAAAYAAVLELAGVDGEVDVREAALLAGLRRRFEADR